MTTIALCCALPREAAPLFAREGEPPAERTGARVAWREVPGARVVVAQGGMGTTNTAATAQLVVDVAHPDAIVFFGIAGGLNPLLGVGDVVVGTCLSRLEADMAIVAESVPHLERFSSDARLVALAEDELAARGFERVASVGEREGGPGLTFGTSVPHRPRYVVGGVATSDLFSTGQEALEKAREGCRADCEEMEGAAAAQVAARAGVPFLCLRCLSNVCGERYEELDGAEGRLNTTARTAADLALGVAGRFALARTGCR